MKPIQKGLAIIAGATLITVLAISFLGKSSQNVDQKDVVEADAKVEAKNSQVNTAADLGSANIVVANGEVMQEKAQAEAKVDASSVTEEGSASKMVAAEKSVDSTQKESSKALSTGDAPAPPGPFHKNAMESSPEMPAAPTAPVSENVDLSPPPMPQALMSAPESPAAPEVNIGKTTIN